VFTTISGETTDWASLIVRQLRTRSPRGEALGVLHAVTFALASSTPKDGNAALCLAGVCDGDAG